MIAVFVALLAGVSVSLAQPTIDGNLSDAQYILLATKANSNSGFGSAIDITKLYYCVQSTNLYLGVAGKLNVSSSDGIGVWLNVTGTGSPTGKAVGQALGIQSTGGHYIGAGNNPTNVNFKADFEVDYMFAFNPGTSSSTVHFDAAKHVGGSVIEYQGFCDQSGTLVTNSSASGSVFSQNSVTFAFNNGGGTTQGLEMRIPFSEIGATPAMQIELLAMVVSSTAYFSDVTVPGNITGGNPGFNVDFSSISGGPYHTTTGGALPVQLASFTAQRIDANSVRLNWRTISEINNYGFFVEKRNGTAQFAEIPGSFQPGHGTTNQPQSYSFVDLNAGGERLHYRLRQVDLDGTIHYSDPIVVAPATGVPEVKPVEFALAQNYPNPFNPSTIINYQLPTNSHVTLKILDVLGREIATLVDEEQSAGFKSVKLDATGLAGGAYFYRLQAGGLAQTKRLILVK